MPYHILPNSHQLRLVLALSISPLNAVRRIL